MEQSELARLLRFSLHGLIASLNAALVNANASTDPGIPACQELLNELTALLKSPADPQTTEPPSTPDLPQTGETIFEPVLPDDSSHSAPIPALRLGSLQAAILSDPDLQSYLGQLQPSDLKDHTDAKLWNEIQHLLLRVPTAMADAWRARISELLQTMDITEDKTDTTLIKIPASRDNVIYPGLTGSVQASGLGWSTCEPFNKELQVNASDEDLYLLAGIVSTCIQFIETDTSLHHALKSIDRFGIRSLNAESERSKYIAVLIDRFKRVQTLETSSDNELRLRARLDLDEAIHSLVYLPPVARDSSWWSKLQQEARRTLSSKSSDYNAKIRPLWGLYADICHFSKDDLELDLGGIPGEVSACLRVYAKINEKIFPGRVLFRSLRRGV
jgi:hypothetical protein